MKLYLLALCLILGTNLASAQKNLVTNGGFEDDLDGWNGTAAKTSPWDFKGGKNSCVLITTDASNWTGIDQEVAIPKKIQALQFDVWLKAENIVKGKDPWNGGIFTIQFLDNQDKKLGDDINIATLSGDEPWSLYTKKIKIPDWAVSFKMLIAMGYASGAMLVDDVSAKAINAEDLGK
jgi:hypothetical protein